MEKKKTINPKKINGQAIILTGKGVRRIAYYVKHHQFLRENNSIIHTQIQCTKQELSQLPQQSGKVDKRKGNKRVINAILNRATSFPTYKYQVYQREVFTSLSMLSSPIEGLGVVDD